MFLSLNASRQNGFEANPFSVCDIVAYLDLYQIFSVEDRVYAFEVLREVDSFWLQEAKKLGSIGVRRPKKPNDGKEVTRQIG